MFLFSLPNELPIQARSSQASRVPTQLLRQLLSGKCLLSRSCGSSCPPTTPFLVELPNIALNCTGFSSSFPSLGYTHPRALHNQWAPRCGLLPPSLPGDIFPTLSLCSPAWCPFGPYGNSHLVAIDFVLQGRGGCWTTGCIYRGHSGSGLVLVWREG